MATTTTPAAKISADQPMAMCPSGKHTVLVRSFLTKQRATGKAFTECRGCRDAHRAAKVFA